MSKGSDTAIVANQYNVELQSFFQNNNVLLFGQSGSGKTTFVQHIQRIVPLRYISMGEMTRSALQYDNDDEIKTLFRRGGKWPVPVIQRIVQPYLGNQAPYVLDGVPKYPDEAQWLSGVISTSPFPTTSVTLNLSTEESYRRQQLRDNSQRPETAVQLTERITTYNENQQAISEILKPFLTNVIEIDVTGATPKQLVGVFIGQLLIGKESV